MKSLGRCALLIVLTLFIALGPAMAAVEAPEEAEAKLQRFYDALVTQGILTGEDPLDAEKNEQVLEGAVTTYYSLGDYMIVTTIADDVFSFSYQLSLLYADIPEEVDADGLYAAFINACADGAGTYEDAAALVAWLREYMVQTSVYGVTASRAYGDYTVTLSASLSDSEETISLTNYTGER